MVSDSFDASAFSDQLSAVDQLLHRGEATPQTMLEELRHFAADRCHQLFWF